MASVQAAFRKGAVLLACTLPLGCGSGPGGGGGGLFAAPGRDRHDGRYEGQRLPPDIIASTTCRARARAVRFDVRNGIIEMRTNRRASDRRRPELWGAVSTDGQVTMRPTSGRRAVVGRIEGDRLTATDTEEGQAMAHAAVQGGKTKCRFRYEAVRVGSRSGPGGGGDASGMAGAPPGEGFPQP